jgi:hypothetical protein
MNLSSTKAMAERITQLHTGSALDAVMCEPTATTERAMLHLVLETMDHNDPHGYTALLAHYKRHYPTIKHNQSMAWGQALERYSNCSTFRWQYLQIIIKLGYGA